MKEWTSYAPDGRRVIIQREGAHWRVTCGSGYAESTNLDLALLQALRAEPDVIAHHRELDYPHWIRKQADTIDHRGGDSEKA